MFLKVLRSSNSPTCWLTISQELALFFGLSPLPFGFHRGFFKAFGAHGVSKDLTTNE